MTERTGRALAWTAFTAAVVYFIARASPRAVRESQDLTVGYAAAHAWLSGRDPYSSAILADELARTGGAALADRGLMNIMLNLYPPTTLPIYLPLALFDWPTAKMLWLAANILAAFFIAFALIRFLGSRLPDARALYLTAFVLSLAPVHTTIAMGQAAVLATAALAGALLLEYRRHAVSAGLLYALATAIKVHIGFPFLAYLLWRRRWRPLGVAAAALVALTCLSTLRMQQADVSWYTSWTNNLVALTSHGGHDDPRRENPGRHSLLNLQYPLHTLIESRSVVNVLVLAFVGGAGLSMVMLIRQRSPQQELLAFSLVGGLSLLVVYHRTYDAVLVALPIAWAFGALGTSLQRPAVATLVLCLAFLVPGQTALFILQQQGRVPEAITRTMVWEMGLLAYQVWALVLLAFVLLYAAYLGNRGPRPEALTSAGDAQTRRSL